jgi:hypothetical protein
VSDAPSCDNDDAITGPDVVVVVGDGRVVGVVADGRRSSK